MKKLLHPVAGTAATAIIATFWLSTVFSELSGSHEAITMVKSAIPWGFLLLVPALAATGGTGFSLANGRRAGLIGTKLKRMPFIAANGVFVLIPSALFLAAKAKAGEFDWAFYGVQVLELAAGTANLILLGISMRDGFRLSRRFKRPSIYGKS